MLKRKATSTARPKIDDAVDQVVTIPPLAGSVSVYWVPFLQANEKAGVQEDRLDSDYRSDQISDYTLLTKVLTGVCASCRRRPCFTYFYSKFI